MPTAKLKCVCLVVLSMMITFQDVTAVAMWQSRTVDWTRRVWGAWAVSRTPNSNSMSTSPLSTDKTSTSPATDQGAFERWRKYAAWTTGLGLTPEESEARQKDKSGQFTAEQRRHCLFQRGDLMRNSACAFIRPMEKAHVALPGPAVTFMLQNLAPLGVNFKPSHVICMPCGLERAGGFSPDLGQVLICQDGILSKKHLEDTLVHELIHVYDHSKFKVDWNDLRHIACSEVGLVIMVVFTPSPIDAPTIDTRG